MRVTGTEVAGGDSALKLSERGQNHEVSEERKVKWFPYFGGSCRLFCKIPLVSVQWDIICNMIYDIYDITKPSSKNGTVCLMILGFNFLFSVPGEVEYVYGSNNNNIPLQGVFTFSMFLRFCKKAE